MAANGIDAGYGSALDVQRDTAMIRAEDVSQGFESGYQRVRRFDISASNYKAEAAAKRAASKAAKAATASGVASTALGAASQVSGYKGGVP